MPGSAPHCAIIGAGPVGTSLALALLREGFAVTLLERESELPADPRAGTIQPPTLEMLDQLGAGPQVLAMGLKAPLIQFRDRDSAAIVAEFDYSRLEAETSHPYALMCEQYKVANANLTLINELSPTTLRLGTEMTDFSQDDAGVELQIRHGADEERLHADFLIGCDGGRSVTRARLDIAFEGFTYEERFLVLTTPADFTAKGYRLRNYVLDPVHWSAIFKAPGAGPPGHWRVVLPDDARTVAGLDDHYLAELFDGLGLTLRLRDLEHHRVYTVNQRVAVRFHEGRVFLAGDAAHVNNPLGGLGMNSGIHDAMNLAAKLTAARNSPDQAEQLFAAYDRERRQIATHYVQAQTIRNLKRLAAKTPAQREAAMAELAAISADPIRHKAWIMTASLIESLRGVHALAQSSN
ncbi:MAG: FAD-dependent monooxygenase [Pseudomonadota bacterium]